MKDSVLKNTFIFSIFVMLAQVIGLVRDLLMVRVFGVGPILDTYYLAFKIPDLLNVFYSVFLGSVIFIPLLTKAKKEGESVMIKEVSKVGSLVSILVILISVLLFIFMPLLSKILAPNWGSEQLSLLVNISRTLLIAQLFFPVGILAGSIGMVHGRSLGMAISGATYNFFILLGAVFLVPVFGIFGVVYGVILGAFMFALVQILPKDVRHIFSKFKFQVTFAEWVSFFLQNIGRFVSVFMYQVYGILTLTFASFAGTGGVTIFYNALNIYMAAFFVMGASLSTAMMPKNSLLHVENKQEELKENLHQNILYMFVFSVFCATFGFLFSKDLLHLIFYFSKIGEFELIQMSFIFGLLCLSLPFFNLLEICRKYMYSVNMITFSTIITFSFTVIFSLLNLSFLKTDFPVFSGLSISIFIANIVTVAIILLVLHREKRVDLIFLLKESYKSVIVGVATGLIYLQLLDNFTIIQITSFSLLLNLFLNCLIVGIVYILLTYIINDKIFKNILQNVLKFIHVR